MEADSRGGGSVRGRMSNLIQGIVLEEKVGGQFAFEGRTVQFHDELGLFPTDCVLAGEYMEAGNGGVDYCGAVEKK